MQAERWRKSGRTKPNSDLKNEVGIILNRCNMKNLLVVLIFSLMSSVAFAETINNPDKSVNVNSEQEAAVATIASPVVETNDHFVNNATDEAKECTIRGKFTITEEGKDPITWEGSLTIVGVSCGELLKQILAQ